MKNDHHSEAVYRILDANANRAGEGIRTIEDAVRFLLNDESLSLGLKTLRHQLTTSLRRMPVDAMLGSRDTPGDVGTQVSLPDEQNRRGVVDVVAAASTRTQQALRCLEEYGKILNAEFGTEVEQIRYQAYDLFAKIQLCFDQPRCRRQLLMDARVYGLVDACGSAQDFEARVDELIDAGIHVIQLRDQSVDDRTLYHRAVLGVERARQSNTLFIVNDRADVAVSADADGVHVGQDELPVDAVRRVVGEERLVGLSTHNASQVSLAHQSSADYIGCGPVFPGATKAFDAYPGCDFLKTVADQITIPAFAIGGIDAGNVHQIAQSGFGRVAVTGALKGSSVKTTVDALQKALSAVELVTQGRKLVD